MTDQLDSALRARLDRLARAVPVGSEGALRPVTSVSPRYRGGSSLGALAAVGLLVLLALVAVSIGGGSTPTESVPPLVEPSPSPMEHSASPAEPSASPVATWGPLAVIPPQDGTDLARNEGTFRITDTCVYLEDAGGDLWLLTWAADQVMWNAESREITFENFDAAFDGSVVTMRDGDHVVLGGGGSSGVESGISGEEWVRRTTWVAPPAPSCSLDPRFHVGIVDDKAAWGPLAVANDDARDDLDAGTGPGRLIVGPRCVTLLMEGGQNVTLIWRSGQTSWDPTARQIVFNDRNVGVIRLSDGERLSLGGAGLADPASPDQGAPQPEWMAPPDPSCPDARWVVHQVYRLGQ